MTQYKTRSQLGKAAIACLFVMIASACDRTSSPEGRMSIQLENLHKELMDSLNKQNQALLDSLGKIREDLQKLQQGR